jgi:hypothetical protein
MVVKVRQRDFEIVVPEEKATPANDISVVQTKIIWTCCGVAGLEVLSR